MQLVGCSSSENLVVILLPRCISLNYLSRDMNKKKDSVGKIVTRWSDDFVKRFHGNPYY